MRFVSTGNNGGGILLVIRDVVLSCFFPFPSQLGYMSFFLLNSII